MIQVMYNLEDVVINPLVEVAKDYVPPTGVRSMLTEVGLSRIPQGVLTLNKSRRSSSMPTVEAVKTLDKIYKCIPKEDFVKENERSLYSSLEYITVRNAMGEVLVSAQVAFSENNIFCSVSAQHKVAHSGFSPVMARFGNSLPIINDRRVNKTGFFMSSSNHLEIKNDGLYIKGRRSADSEINVTAVADSGEWIYEFKKAAADFRNVCEHLRHVEAPIGNLIQYSPFKQLVL